jgi:hypothetical protein
MGEKSHKVTESQRRRGNKATGKLKDLGGIAFALADDHGFVSGDVDDC